MQKLLVYAVLSLALHNASAQVSESIAQVEASERILPMADVLMLHASVPTTVRFIDPPMNASPADCTHDCRTVRVTLLLSDKVTVGRNGNIGPAVDGYQLPGQVWTYTWFPRLREWR